MKVTLLIDIGSTYTKIVAVDLEKETIVGRTYAPSTVATDMSVGLKQAYARLLEQTGTGLEIERRVACSSAAGGLRLMACGLVPSLTTEAAKRAALGAGAKVIGVYSYQLSRGELEEIERVAPDIILLAGGTDGGNAEVLLRNAASFAGSKLACPFIICGNKVAADDAAVFLKNANKTAEICCNVLPELGSLNVEPCRSAIREIFIKRIVQGKRLDRAQEFVGGIIMPTPLAVMKAAQLLANGTPEEKGMGELMVVDVGGATTNVISMAEGTPSRAGVIKKGLPDAYASRTVEGDLGIRYNAVNILELAGEEQIFQDMSIWDDVHLKKTELEEGVRYLPSHIDAVPRNKREFLIDIGLARSAIRIASSRHAGNIEQAYYPSGVVYIQQGKDLTGVKKIIGTGGIMAYGKEQRYLLQAATFNAKMANSLRPVDPELLVDTRYILYAIGLISQIVPEKALRIAKRNLKALNKKIA